MLPLSIQAGLWGLLSGSALVLGALLAWFARVPERAVAAVMAFGSGVLISALSFELMDEAYQRGGFLATGAGFLGGAAVYTAANVSVRHVLRLGAWHDAHRPGAAARWLACVLLPAALCTLAAFAVLARLTQGAAPDLIAPLFRAVAALTLPHMLVTSWLAHTEQP